MTVDEIIQRRTNQTTGFDYLRLGLALGVVFFHTLGIAAPTLGDRIWQSAYAPISLAILPAFFALSGFLVAGSLLRNSVSAFLYLRLLRIMPALAVDVSASALVLGTLFTTIPLVNYFYSPDLRAYFLNIFGYIHYTLPGVFNGRQINVQLWTIPFELECYAALVVLFFVGLLHRPKAILLILSASATLMTFLAVIRHWYVENWNVPGRMLPLTFLFGVAIYLNRGWMPYSRKVMLLNASISILFLEMPNLVFLAAFPIAYVVVYIGLMNLRAIPFGDLSYGIYLFHYPLARSIHEVCGRSLTWEALLLLTILSTFVFSTLSWNFIEHPVLARKKQILAWLDANLSAPLGIKHLVGKPRS